MREPGPSLLRSIAATALRSCSGYKRPRRRRRAQSGLRSSFRCWLITRRCIHNTIDNFRLFTSCREGPKCSVWPMDGIGEDGVKFSQKERLCMMPKQPFISIPLDIPDLRVLQTDLTASGNYILTVESTLESTICRRCGQEIHELH